jgi:hypothetical protein
MTATWMRHRVHIVKTRQPLSLLAKRCNPRRANAKYLLVYCTTYRPVARTNCLGLRCARRKPNFKDNTYDNYLGLYGKNKRITHRRRHREKFQLYVADMMTSMTPSVDETARKWAAPQLFRS